VKTKAIWEEIGQRAHHGIVVPLSALRSKHSCGVGEFLDLLLVIDFCKKVHFDTIQLLPLYDTGRDTSPYNGVSSCALDPLYLSLRELPLLDASLVKEFEGFDELNRLREVALHEVKQKKMRWLYRYYQHAFPALSKDAPYQEFYQENQSWLIPYAQYKSLSNQFQHIHWSAWTQPYPEISDTDFYTFLQFLCFSQMRRVKKYAGEQGCFLKGDLPILVGSDSADVWAQPHLFDLNYIAGAPPDQYNAEGQKWSFPIFNWDAMRENKFAWWKRRLHVAESLYHIYRIDHVVGLFRIWAIPQDKKAIEGHFIPWDFHLWEKQGREILTTMIEATSMLPIAEDLGTIPKEVPVVLKELGICGTKVVRWEKQWHYGNGFIPLDEYEPFSLTTVSTHDSETLGMWWKNDPQDAKLWAERKGWAYHPTMSIDERFSCLYDAHHSASYFHINLLQEYLALFPELVSEELERERINIPGTVLPSNWAYRFRPSIEEMLENGPLIEKMISLTKKE
jgi:4-alpha-glucanotransferase